MRLPLVLLLLLPLAATAQVDRIDTDRPDQTESATLVSKNWLQFEMGFNKQRNIDKGDYEYLHPTLLSKYGINKRFEFRLITTLATTTSLLIPTGTVTTSGWQPVEIGGKVAICEERGLLPKTSLIFHFAIPTLASKAFVINKVAPNFRFTLQNSITDDIAIGYNLGAEWDGFSNEPTWIYTFAPGFNLGKRFYPGHRNTALMADWHGMLPII
jgi:hypothetical protein